MPLFFRLTKKLRYSHPTPRVKCVIIQYKSDIDDRCAHPAGSQLLAISNKKIDGQSLPLHHRGGRQFIKKIHSSNDCHRRSPEDRPRISKKTSKIGLGLMRGKSARGRHPPHPKIDEQLLKHRQSLRQRFITR